MSRADDASPAGVFFALGDETRLSLVRKLGDGVPRTATTISDGARITRQAIVKHLRVLEGAGLVRRDRHGREVLYALEPRRLDEARASLEAVSARWDRAIERLRDLVEEPSPSSRRR